MKRIVSIALLLALGLGIVGCGGESTSTPAGGTAAPAGGTTPPADTAKPANPGDNP
jgi:hypothetical protein